MYLKAKIFPHWYIPPAKSRADRLSACSFAVPPVVSAPLLAPAPPSESAAVSDACRSPAWSHQGRGCPHHLYCRRPAGTNSSPGLKAAARDNWPGPVLPAACLRGCGLSAQKYPESASSYPVLSNPASYLYCTTARETKIGQIQHRSHPRSSITAVPLPAFLCRCNTLRPAHCDAESHDPPHPGLLFCLIPSTPAACPLPASGP